MIFLNFAGFPLTPRNVKVEFEGIMTITDGAIGRMWTGALRDGKEPFPKLVTGHSDPSKNVISQVGVEHMVGQLHMDAVFHQK